MSSEAKPPLGIAHSQLSEVVAARLREQILRRDYKPGARLVEGRLADVLGVSRIPVREALRLLASEGLVEITPRRGATVASLSPGAAREMVEVRATLEGLNARLAARHRDPLVLAGIQEVLAAGSDAARAGESGQLVALNARFHDLLAAAGNNSILGDLMRSLRDRTSLVFAVFDNTTARQTWEEHAAILQAVMAGDEDLAALLATRHVMNAGALALREN
jgi:DNA-binding GntR family transcriptional regulator